jgi:hypothetical protein
MLKSSGEAGIAKNTAAEKRRRRLPFSHLQSAEHSSMSAAIIQ